MKIEFVKAISFFTLKKYYFLYVFFLFLNFHLFKYFYFCNIILSKELISSLLLLIYRYLNFYLSLTMIFYYKCYYKKKEDFF